MKILMVVDGMCFNPYVQSLQDGLRELGHTVTMSTCEFWRAEGRYDVVHFHWPQTLFQWNENGITADDVQRVAGQLKKIKESGTAVVYTRHNSISHACSNPMAAELLRLVERESDTIVHMGAFSKREVLRQKSGAATQRHVIIPHHAYDWYKLVSRAKARKRLGLKESAKVVLSFGVFRTDEERMLVADACQQARIPGLNLIAPLLFVGLKGTDAEHVKDEIRRRVGDLMPKQRTGRISDEDLPLYFAAADVVFLQRVSILNSGNLPLGFFLSKVVVGPDVGNVGEILRQTGNLVFNPSRPETAARAIRRAVRLAASGKGAENREYALTHWSSKKVSRALVAAYRDALGQKSPCVSVLMPSLNTAQYIKEAIDSVLGQTLKNLELICIDAGSTDGTREIISAYASKDSRVQLIDSPVKSYGYQMNLGLQAAKGQYVGIVEPDDYMSTSAYEELYSQAVAAGLDIIKGDCDMFSENAGKDGKHKIASSLAEDRSLCGKVIDPVRHPSIIRSGTLGTTLGIYRRRMLVENGIRYNESPGAAFQDTGFFFQTMICARRLKVVKRAYYHYRQDNAASSRNDKGKLMVLWKEYEFIDRVLSEMPSIRERLLVFRPYILARNFSGQLWSARRVGLENACALIEKTGAKFAPIVASGELRESYMVPAEWKILQSWIKRAAACPANVCKVSVIIPCYNVAPYVGACLDSVLGQTLREIECVCVDDGSSDDTAKILDEYAARDARVRVYRQANRGVYEARNRAIANAKGEFVAFMDPDDLYPANGVLERLYEVAVKQHVLVAGGSLQSFLPDGSLSKFQKPQNVFAKEGMVRYSDYQWALGYQRFIYSRPMLERNRIGFPPYTRFQDPPFMASAMIVAGSFYAIPDVTYSYRIGHKRVDWQSNDCRRFRDLLKALAALARLADAAGLPLLMRLVESEWTAHLDKVVKPDPDMLASCAGELNEVRSVISGFEEREGNLPSRKRNHLLHRAAKISLAKLLVPYGVLRLWTKWRYGYAWPRGGWLSVLPFAAAAILQLPTKRDRRWLKYLLPYSVMCQWLHRVHGRTKWYGVPLDGAHKHCPDPARGRRAWLPFGIVLWLDKYLK